MRGTLRILAVCLLMLVSSALLAPASASVVTSKAASGAKAGKACAKKMHNRIAKTPKGRLKCVKSSGRWKWKRLKSKSAKSVVPPATPTPAPAGTPAPPAKSVSGTPTPENTPNWPFPKGRTAKSLTSVLADQTLTPAQTITGAFSNPLLLAAAPTGGDVYFTNNSSNNGGSDSSMRFGTTWAAQSASQANQWQSVAYDGSGLYVAVASNGTNRVMTSPDGINWTNRSASQANSWVSVTYGNGLFVAVSTNGTNRVMTSPDGINWTNRTAAAANSWEKVTFGDNLFVAVSSNGTDRVMTSPDGINWTSRTDSQDNRWMSVVYDGSGLYVAVSRDGTNRVMTSPDGINWTNRTAAAANSWQSVTYGNGLFVAVSSNGTNRVMTSPDGITWTSRTAAAANSWQSVTSGGDMFVSVSTSGTAMQSPDGITWSTRAVPEANTWVSVTSGGSGSFVAVSTNGTNRVMQWAGAYSTDQTTTTGDIPFEIIVDDTNTYAFVSNWWSNSVSRITLATGATTTVNVGQRPAGIALSGTTLWVVQAIQNGSLTKITNATSGTFPQANVQTSAVMLGAYPLKIDFNPPGTNAYVTHYEYGASGGLWRIGAINTAPVVSSLAFSQDSWGIVVDQYYVYVVNNSGDSITALNFPNPGGVMTVYKTLSLGAGAAPYDAEKDASSTYLYVAEYGTNEISRLTLSTITNATPTVTTIASATDLGGPIGLASAPNGTLFVSGWDSNKISGLPVP